MNENEIRQRVIKLGKNWEVIAGKKLRRGFEFDNFMEAIDFINAIARESDKLNHHPDIYNSYIDVNIEISTHKIGELSELDFVLAEKINQIYRLFKKEK